MQWVNQLMWMEYQLEATQPAATSWLMTMTQLLFDLLAGWLLRLSIRSDRVFCLLLRGTKSFHSLLATATAAAAIAAAAAATVPVAAATVPVPAAAVAGSTATAAAVTAVSAGPVAAAVAGPVAAALIADRLWGWGTAHGRWWWRRWWRRRWCWCRRTADGWWRRCAACSAATAAEA